MNLRDQETIVCLQNKISRYRIDIPPKERIWEEKMIHGSQASPKPKRENSKGFQDLRTIPYGLMFFSLGLLRQQFQSVELPGQWPCPKKVLLALTYASMALIFMSFFLHFVLFLSVLTGIVFPGMKFSKTCQPLM
jgi:hypothetical protein